MTARALSAVSLAVLAVDCAVAAFVFAVSAVDFAVLAVDCAVAAFFFAVSAVVFAVWGCLRLERFNEIYDQDNMMNINE